MYLVMLSYSTANDWLLPDTWTCLLSVLTTYVTSPNVLVHSEENISPLVLPANWALYISNRFQPVPRPPLPVVMSAVLIFKSLPQVYLDGKYERVVVVTEDMENVTNLWTRSRILETVILVPNKTHLNAYTWYPYRRETCFNKPALELIDVCNKGNWKRKIFPKKLPKQFSGCPVYYKSIHTPPDNVEQADGRFTGREPILMDMVAKSLNLSVHYKPSTLDFYDFGKEGDNMCNMILRGEVDFGFASLILADILNKFTEPLPCYRDQPIEWMLPLAKEKSRINSIYSVFPYEMWAVLFIVAFISGLLITVVSNFEGHSWYWIDIISVTVASPIHTSESLFIRLFLLYFQFYSLHIAWFYQGTLLNNLVNNPMEKQISDAQGALDAQLPVYLYPWLEMYFNHSDHELWNQMLMPQNHFSTYFIPYDEIVNDKTAFLLGVTVRDGWELRKKYRKSLSNMVYLAPFINSLVTVYGHRGSPLTMLYNKRMLFIIESGIFWHLTVLEIGYNDLPRERATNDAKTLTLEPLQGVFLLLVSLIFWSLVVFLIELIYFYSDHWLRRLGCLQKKRPQRRPIDIIIY